jgi:hypothetical protein
VSDKLWLTDDLSQRRLFARPTFLFKIKTLPPLGWWALGMIVMIFLVNLTALLYE